MVIFKIYLIWIINVSCYILHLYQRKILIIIKYYIKNDLKHYWIIFRLQEADLGFHLIIDRRNDKWNSVKTVLLKISVSIYSINIYSEI